MNDPVIGSVGAAAYTVPTDAPEADGTLSWDATTLVLARVGAGGQEGIGWTYGAAASAALIGGQLASVVRGQPAIDVAGCSEAMIRAVRNVTRPGVAGYAISAVDVALWDLKAKLLGLPLHRLLGAVRADVPVYGSGGFTAYGEGELREQLSGWVSGQRIPRVKIKIGESWGSNEARDLARMRQARETVGAGTELFVDANGGYGRKQAIRIMAAPPTWTCAGSKSRSPPMTWTACARSGTPSPPTSRPVSTAGTCPTSAGCARPARSTACRPTRPGAGDHRVAAGRGRGRLPRA